MYRKITLFIVLIIVMIGLSACKEPTDDLDKNTKMYSVEGKSEYWEVTLEYGVMEDETIEYDRIVTEGDLIYVGNKSPKTVDIKFVLYDIEPTSYYNGNVNAQSITIESKGEQVKDSKIRISEFFNKKHKSEVYKEAINHGYIEVNWDEKGKDKKEKINIEIIEQNN